MAETCADYLHLPPKLDLHCWGCKKWCGRCLKGKINRIARDDACFEFEPRTSTSPENATANPHTPS
jgi:hypothetical protein